MIAVSGGSIMLLSTPFGKRGFFHQVWSHSQPWLKIQVTADQCPRLTPEFLAEELVELGERWYAQEYNCNPPEAPIWMGDYSFQPLGHVQVGDTVIGWAQPSNRRRRYLVRAQVVAVGRREAKIVEVRLESGNVIYCTPDHQWLTMTRALNRYPGHFQPAAVGKHLVRIIRPTPPLPEHLRWDAAWLGGIYDGEGCADQIAQSFTHNQAIYERICQVLTSLGFRISHNIPKGVYILSGKGGRDRKQALVDFLNWTRPRKCGLQMDREILTAYFRHPDRVVSVRPAGRSEVVSLQTTTGNYVVWGYASKNCQFVEAVGQVFSDAAIDAAFRDDITPLFGESPEDDDSVLVELPALFAEP